MWRSFVIALVGAVALAFAGTAMGSGITNAGDDLRTGWYPDEAALSPTLVSSSSFGQLWSATVDGQVYAQPLLSQAGTLVVATENDKVYGLDAKTGAQQWFTDLGTPWNPADVGCGDMTPSIGTTATPVIDPATNTVYLTHKTYVSGAAAWFMDALDATTGQERSGWPVRLSGHADNASSVSFAAATQQQRPGLLLMDGVVYAGFGAHCDVAPYQGWVFGVSTTTHNTTARWVDNVAGDGDGIWQSGVGLTSDGSGSILLATGNGISLTTPTPGHSPPATLGESVVRLHVQPNGTLTAVDFFEPFDATQLDQFDADFGSGGVVGLPDAYFGTSSNPHLAVVVGKQGYVYLLDRDNLGGFAGSSGGDNVLQRLGPHGGVWGRPGVWPGDGGYVYIPTSSGQVNGGLLDVYKYGVTASHTPSLSLVASSPTTAPFGWGSGSPVVTSDGTTSGTALVWIIWSADRSGTGGQLRAYDPIPVSGAPHLRWSAAIGHAANYSTPGVGDGRVYVGTRDGKVLAFGSPVTAPLSGSGLSFATTTIGNTSQQTMTLTATRNVQISSITSPSSQFTVGTPSRALPATLNTGDQISIPITFAPTQPGPVGGEVDLATTGGPLAYSLAGTGQSPTPQLAADPPILSLGGTTTGSHLTGTVTFSNVGNGTLTINAVHLPSAPFSVPTPPVAGDTIAPGASITVDISFDPTAIGSFFDQIGLDTNGGNESIGLSAAAGAPGLLQIANETNDYGSVPVGTTVTTTFTITNVGGSTVTITKSKPPFGGEFAATTALPEGTTIPPGQTVTETVSFTPTSAGPATGTWVINSDDGSGLHNVQFTGTGVDTSTTTTTTSATTTTTTQSSGSTTVVHPHIQVPHPPRIAPSVTTADSIRSLLMTYTGTAATTTKFTLQRAMAGRRTAQACARMSAANRTARRCVYWGTVARFAHLDVVGANRLRITGQVRAAVLVPGTYRVQSVFTAANGTRYTFYTFFRVTPAPRHAARRHAARGR